MSDKLVFHFGIPTLLQEGGSICKAAAEHAEQLKERLAGDFVQQTQALIVKVGGDEAALRSNFAAVDTLTQEQQANLAVVQDSLSKVRDTARRAFKGQDVKLREEFQIGINRPNDLSANVHRARIVIASCRVEANSAALAARGWLAKDTDALAEVIEKLSLSAESQETAKTAKAGAAGQRNRDANELYDRILTIQNAADIQWPERDGANEAVRGEFRLGTFPPKMGGSAKEKEPETPPASAAPPAAAPSGDEKS